MLKTLVPRSTRSILSSRASHAGPSNLRSIPSVQVVSQQYQSRRGYASEAPDYDVVFIGGGVAGYVGAIKAGQEGLKVRDRRRTMGCFFTIEVLIFVALDSMYREARLIRRNVSQCRMHTLEIPPQQLTSVPSNTTRHKETRNRCWRRQAESHADDES